MKKCQRWPFFLEDCAGGIDSLSHALGWLGQRERGELLVVDPARGQWAMSGWLVWRWKDWIDRRFMKKFNKFPEMLDKEETNIDQTAVYLEQLFTFGKPGRDPRTRVITVAHFALVGADKIDPKAADDAADVGWFSAYEPPKLAFDHAEILEYAITRLRYKKKSVVSLD